MWGRGWGVSTPHWEEQRVVTKHSGSNTGVQVLLAVQLLRVCFQTGEMGTMTVPKS